jgi:hypothetical protein
MIEPTSPGTSPDAEQEVMHDVSNLAGVVQDAQDEPAARAAREDRAERYGDESLTTDNGDGEDQDEDNGDDESAPIP